MRSELAGVSVLLTRDDPSLARLLAERGACVVTLPCVWTEPLDAVSLRAELAGISADDALVLTSAAGVDAVAAAVDLGALPIGEVVLARSDLALDDLPAILRARGARVREVVAYRTHAQARGDVGAAREALEANRAAAVVASPSALAGLLAAVGAERITRALVVATGPTTAAAVSRVLGTAPLVAAAPDAAAVAEALEEGMRVVAR